MTTHISRQEALVLELLRSNEYLTMEEAAARLPELNWCQLFDAVDALSRRGAIILIRRGFDYLLRARESTGATIPLAS
jgi:hypothetical protein